jgi:molecular chaperone DnaK (HSP70)
MVGGGSRIPRFIETVENVFKMAASRTTNSSENIAEGTTLAAVQFSNLFRLHSFKILNRSAHKIRVSWK